MCYRSSVCFDLYLWLEFKDRIPSGFCLCFD
nr:MAG TPA: RloB-like protein [Caudoviricetes sp.]DAW95789.1 MAG TPA: RloB-like protein [Caudoviricetes sp.]